MELKVTHLFIVFACYLFCYAHYDDCLKPKVSKKGQPTNNSQDTDAEDTNSNLEGLEGRTGRCFGKKNHSHVSTTVDFSWEYFNEACCWSEEHVSEEPQIQEDEVEKFRHLCNDKPVIIGNNSINSPGNGFIFVYKQHMFVLEAPITLKHYPKVLRVNPITHYALEPTVTRMDVLSKVDSLWFGAIAFQRNFHFYENKDEGILEALFFGFDALDKRPRIIPEATLQNEMKIYFLGVPKATNGSEFHRKARRYLDAVFIYVDDNDMQGLIVEDIFGYVYAKFKMNGNVEMDKNQVELKDTDDQHLEAIDQFDFDADQQSSLGYRSYGLYYRNFNSKICSPTHCLTGLGVYFQNQALIGCPPDQCHYGSVDAATKIGDDVILVFDQYYWHLPDESGQRKATFQNVLRIKDIKTFGLEERFRVPISDIFLYDNKMYIMKPVFSKTERLVWVSKSTTTTLNDTIYMQYSIEDIFPNMDPNVWVGRIDATLVMENRLFIFKGDSYYVYDMSLKEMDSSYLKKFPFDLNLYPRATADFEGLPQSIDTAYTDGKGTTYFFHGNYIYKSEGRKDMPKSPVTMEYLQQSYFSCDNFDFGATPYKTKVKFEQEMMKYLPLKAVDKSEYSIKKVLMWASIAWILIILVAVGTLIFAQVYDYRLQNRRRIRFKLASMRKDVKTPGSHLGGGKRFKNLK